MIKNRIEKLNIYVKKGVFITFEHFEQHDIYYLILQPLLSIHSSSMSKRMLILLMSLSAPVKTVMLELKATIDEDSKKS